MTRALLALLLAVTCSVGASAEDLSEYKVPTGFLPQVGEQLPTFTLHRLDGGSASLATFAGRPLVATFFFSDCAPCVRDVGALNAFAASNSGLGVVAITFDTAERATRFVQEHGLGWPVLVEAQAYFDQIGVLAFPSFVVVDHQGVLVGATYGNRLGGEDGTVTASGLEAWVRSMLPDA